MADIQVYNVARAGLTLKDDADKFRQSSVSRYTIGDNISEQLHNLKMSTPPSAPSSPTNDSYEIVPLTENDIESVILFLRKFFFKDEPLNVEQNLLETDDATCAELEDFCIQSIKENVSLMAVSPSGQVLGVCINAISRPNKCVDDSEQCENPKFKKILKLLYTIDKQADVFGKFPDIDSTMDVKILSVDDACRGRGIAKALMDRTRQLAKELGYEMMRVDCTSHYSAKAVERLGLECVYTLKYADYQVDGKPVFTPEPPHNEVKVYVQRVH